MKIRRHPHPYRASEHGQTMIPIFIFIGLFLLAMLGVAADYTQLWAHRQMAQGAADAACQAGAADLFINAINPTAGGQNGLLPFGYIGTPFNCSTNTATAICRYAALNGYTTGSNVNVTFPSSLPGVTSLPSALATAHPYLEVTITDPVAMSFTRMVGGASTVNVTAKAGCGVAPANVPIPLVILHPTSAASISVSGASLIKVFGGPQRSVQVDSSSATAASVGSVDLSQGGPSNSGSDFAVLGGPATQPGGISLGSTGHYLYPSTPFGDPFSTYNAPSAPSTPGAVNPVPFGMNGCPDPNGCVEFTPGDYRSCTSSGNISPGDKGCLSLPYTGSNPKFKNIPGWTAQQNFAQGAVIQPTSNNANFVFVATTGGKTGNTQPTWNIPAPNPCTLQTNGTCTGSTVTDGTVTWQNVGVINLNKLSTGIFDPGLYFVGTPGLSFGDGSTARISCAPPFANGQCATTGDTSNGVMFYFNSSGSVSVTSSSGNGKPCTSASNNGNGSPNGCVVSYKVDGSATGAALGPIRSRPLQCPQGSANLAQVPTTLDGNILLGPCSGTYASPDGNRGFLFFQRTAANPRWGGGGQFLSSGFMYFHSGVGGTCGTSTSCLTLQGGSGSQSFTLGNIVVDKLALGGNPQINMILNPTATFEVLRPTLLE
ncbi:MAG TPA: pilus assembly protein TadG-related protein [Candidatus Limnocylindrales bacterium]|jgi:hypothetical protein|nr:pilus assembly protein TadG-related protein [Candidatus Limnocylindrales bacterium]